MELMKFTTFVANIVSVFDSIYRTTKKSKVSPPTWGDMIMLLNKSVFFSITQAWPSTIDIVE